MSVVTAGPRLPERSALAPPPGTPGEAGRGNTLEDFRLGFDLLRRYPLMVAPPLIAMGVVFVAGVLVFGSAMGLFAAGGLSRHGAGIVGAVLGIALLVVVFLVVAMLINLTSSAVVVVMASDALAARPPSLAAAYGRVMGRLGDVVGASFLCAAIIGIGSMFLLVPGLIAAFFLVFALPAVLLDGAGSMESLRQSAVLVRDNLARTLGLVIGTVVASTITWLVSVALHAVTILGHLASTLLAGALFAYLTVVAVCVFHAVSRR